MSSQSAPHLIVEKERGRARLVLNRPEKHNAVSGAMANALHDALWEADADDAVHAIVIKGNGPSFCSGGALTGYGEAPGRGGPIERTGLFETGYS